MTLSYERMRKGRSAGKKGNILVIFDFELKGSNIFIGASRLLLQGHFPSLHLL